MANLPCSSGKVRRLATVSMHFIAVGTYSAKMLMSSVLRDGRATRSRILGTPTCHLMVGRGSVWGVRNPLYPTLSGCILLINSSAPYRGFCLA